MDYGAFESQLGRFVDYCREHLDFGIDDMKYYSCLPLCALDAVFSIGVKYTGVSRTVDNFCKEYGISREAKNPYRLPSTANQKTVGQVLEMLRNVSPEDLAAIIRNRQRTSSKNGILKTAAFIQWLDILESYGIQTYQDFHKHWSDCNLENNLRSVRGQKSGISTDYFYMLAGKTTEVKVDRHITSFVCEALEKQNVSATTIKALFREAVKDLTPEHPGLTVRRLDYIVWAYQEN